jgi:hypothetical protein
MMLRLELVEGNNRDRDSLIQEIEVFSSAIPTPPESSVWDSNGFSSSEVLRYNAMVVTQGFT